MFLQPTRSEYAKHLKDVMGAPNGQSCGVTQFLCLGVDGYFF
jgi:hypothetical protein